MFHFRIRVLPSTPPHRTGDKTTLLDSKCRPSQFSRFFPTSGIENLLWIHSRHGQPLWQIECQFLNRFTSVWNTDITVLYEKVSLKIRAGCTPYAITVSYNNKIKRKALQGDDGNSRQSNDSKNSSPLNNYWTNKTRTHSVSVFFKSLL